MTWRKSNLRGKVPGDRVFTARHGWKEIAALDRRGPKPFVIQTEAGLVSFSIDGKEDAMDKYPTCWPECPYTEDPDLSPIDRPTFRIDHKIMVRDTSGAEDPDAVPWEKAYFAGWPENVTDRGIMYFAEGKSSYTGGVPVYAPEWKDAEEKIERG